MSQMDLPKQNGGVPRSRRRITYTKKYNHFSTKLKINRLEKWFQSSKALRMPLCNKGKSHSYRELILFNSPIIMLKRN